MPQETEIFELWTELEKIIDSGNAPHLEAFVQLLPPAETAYTISRLPEFKQSKLFELLSPEFAADLLGHFSDEQAADLIEELPAEHAADIIEELESDEQADLLQELDGEDAQAILAQMDPQDAADARILAAYDPDTAGGMMFTEFIAYPQAMRVDEVIRDLRHKAAEYEDYDIHYVYITDEAGKLAGVLRLRALVVAQGDKQLGQVMTGTPVSARVAADVNELEDLFDRYDFTALPVVDEAGKLVGVVHQGDVAEHLGEQAEEDLMKFGGIIGGEELRSEPLKERALRRMLFLVPNIALSFVSVCIIAAFEPIIQKLTALAVFLPLVANLSGATGNQAVAVSIRELTLGILKPADVRRVFEKEVLLGFINGVIIGIALGLIAWIMRPDSPGLALLIGIAFAVNSVLAVVLGGTIPLMLKRLGADPAMASSPILTTVTDMSSFLLVLGGAAYVAPSILN
ncbi:MAG: magnesium transporter [Phycisphaeraceae bacterium]